MMKALRLVEVNAVVATIYVAAMLAFGFAHSPLVLQPPADPTRALLQLAASVEGGAICRGAGDAHHVHHAGECAACQLNAAPGLAPSPGVVLRAPSCFASLAPEAEPARPVFRSVARANSRGPPSI